MRALPMRCAHYSTSGATVQRRSVLDSQRHRPEGTSMSEKANLTIEIVSDVV